jgi:hypothetical protein
MLDLRHSSSIPLTKDGDSDIWTDSGALLTTCAVILNDFREEVASWTDSLAHGERRLGTVQNAQLAPLTFKNVDLDPAEGSWQRFLLSRVR